MKSGSTKDRIEIFSEEKKATARREKADGVGTRHPANKNPTV